MKSTNTTELGDRGLSAVFIEVEDTSMIKELKEIPFDDLSRRIIVPRLGQSAWEAPSSLFARDGELLIKADDIFKGCQIAVNPILKNMYIVDQTTKIPLLALAPDQETYQNQILWFNPDLESTNEFQKRKGLTIEQAQEHIVQLLNRSSAERSKLTYFNSISRNNLETLLRLKPGPVNRSEPETRELPQRASHAYIKLLFKGPAVIDELTDHRKDPLTAITNQYLMEYAQGNDVYNEKRLDIWKGFNSGVSKLSDKIGWPEKEQQLRMERASDESLFYKLGMALREIQENPHLPQNETTILQPVARTDVELFIRSLSSYTLLNRRVTESDMRDLLEVKTSLEEIASQVGELSGTITFLQRYITSTIFIVSSQACANCAARQYEAEATKAEIQYQIPVDRNAVHLVYRRSRALAQQALAIQDFRELRELGFVNIPNEKRAIYRHIFEFEVGQLTKGFVKGIGKAFVTALNTKESTAKISQKDGLNSVSLTVGQRFNLELKSYTHEVDTANTEQHEILFIKDQRNRRAKTELHFKNGELIDVVTKEFRRSKVNLLDLVGIIDKLEPTHYYAKSRHQEKVMALKSYSDSLNTPSLLSNWLGENPIKLLARTPILFETAKQSDVQVIHDTNDILSVRIYSNGTSVLVEQNKKSKCESITIENYPFSIEYFKRNGEPIQISISGLDIPTLSRELENLADNSEYMKNKNGKPSKSGRNLLLELLGKLEFADESMISEIFKSMSQKA